MTVDGRAEMAIIHCTRCREYKGVTECSICSALLCVFCEGAEAEENSSFSKRGFVLSTPLDSFCDHLESIVGLV